jgi:hypothetical protein
MLAPGCPDGLARPDATHAAAPDAPCTSSCFFGTHVSSCCCAPRLLLSAQMHMREREHNTRTPMREREHNMRVLMQDKPLLHLRERDHTGRTQCEREHSAHAPMREREREHNAHAHVLSRLHAPPWWTTPGGAGALGAACACS